METRKAIERISESCFFEKIKKINKPLSRLKRENTQITKIRNKRGDITTDATETQRIVRDYYELSYANNLENVKEIDGFLETYHPPRLYHEEIENLNRPITTKEIDSIIKNLQQRKVQDHRASGKILTSI